MGGRVLACWRSTTPGIANTRSRRTLPCPRIGPATELRGRSRRALRRLGTRMRRLTVGEVHAQKVAELGLDPTALDLTSIEGLASAVRRAATFLCPCSAATLVRGVVRPLRGLVPDLEALKGLVEETLEAMIAHGDILEQRDL